MGLFGGKKTYVSSTCYNLAGDEETRPDYLKTMVTANVIGSNGRSSMGDSIRDGYLNGPSIKLRGFYRWAEDNYNSVIGLSSSGLSGAPDIDPGVVASYLPGSASIQMIRSNLADYEVWAEQWVLTNYPEQIDTAWSADYSDTTNQVTVTLAGGSVHSFAPAGFQKDALYIYVAYNTITEGGAGPVTSDGVVHLAAGESFPSTAGWTAAGGGVYEKTDYMGNDGTGRLYSIKSVMTQTEVSPTDRYYEITHQQITVKSWSPLQIFIYRVGSGIAALDAQVATTTSIGGFFPPIPVRVDNKFISETYLASQYGPAKKAYKRLTAGGSFDDLVAKLADNADLPDIDYVFAVPGVSLNVVENSCRKYLYEFFAGAMLTSVYDEVDYGDWSSGIGSATGSIYSWNDWLDAQGSGGPLDGAPEPTITSYGSAPRNEIRVRTTNASLGYDTRIAWKSIKEDIGGGLAKPDAKVGEVWLAKGGVFQEAGPTYSGFVGLINSVDSASEDLLIYWQTSLTSWKRLTIRGLVHQNFVYKGKYVEIKAHEALDDLDESGFIVPIHYETWRAMSIRDTTQMATASIFLVINSYKVKKKKWYQTGIFKLVLFIVIVIISIYYPPLGLSAGSGLLGTGAAVGAALGLTGAMAVLVGAIANALAAMILVKLLTAASVALLGDRLGSIVAAVVAFAALQIGTGMQAGLSIGEALSSVMNPLSLLAMTNAIGQGITGYIQAGIQGSLNKTQDVLEQYKDQSRSISQLYEQNIGYGRGMIDPTMLTDAGQWFAEPGETFLARTLMTGSQIAELSNSLLSDFSDLTLSTDLPF